MEEKTHWCECTALASLIILFQFRFILEELKMLVIGIIKVMKTKFKGVLNKTVAYSVP